MNKNHVTRKSSARFYGRTYSESLGIPSISDSNTGSRASFAIEFEKDGGEKQIIKDTQTKEQQIKQKKTEIKAAINEMENKIKAMEKETKAMEKEIKAMEKEMEKEIKAMEKEIKAMEKEMENKIKAMEIKAIETNERQQAEIMRKIFQQQEKLKAQKPNPVQIKMAQYFIEVHKEKLNRLKQEDPVTLRKRKEKQIEEKRNVFKKQIEEKRNVFKKQIEEKNERVGRKKEYIKILQEKLLQSLLSKEELEQFDQLKLQNSRQFKLPLSTISNNKLPPINKKIAQETESASSNAQSLQRIIEMNREETTPRDENQNPNNQASRKNSQSTKKSSKKFVNKQIDSSKKQNWIPNIILNCEPPNPSAINQNNNSGNNLLNNENRTQTKRTNSQDRMDLGHEIDPTIRNFNTFGHNI